MDCSICRDPTCTDHLLVLSCCDFKQTVHLNCMKDWTNRSGQCPYCRKNTKLLLDPAPDEPISQAREIAKLMIARYHFTYLYRRREERIFGTLDELLNFFVDGMMRIYYDAQDTTFQDFLVDYDGDHVNYADFKLDSMEEYELWKSETIDDVETLFTCERDEGEGNLRNVIRYWLYPSDKQYRKDIEFLYALSGRENPRSGTNTSPCDASTQTKTKTSRRT